MDNEHRAPSLPTRLATGLGLALLTLLILGGPPVGLFFLLWHLGGDENASLALVISGLVGLCWLLVGMKIVWALMRRVQLRFFNHDIGKLER